MCQSRKASGIRTCPSVQTSKTTATPKTTLRCFLDQTHAASPSNRAYGFSTKRVETTLAHLTESCGLTYPGAHSTWGLLMRVAAKGAAYNLGIMINRLLGRPDFAFATLIV